MDVYCPWMVIALYFLDRSIDELGFYNDKFRSLIGKWAKNNSVYENAIKHYMPDTNWRLVPKIDSLGFKYKRSSVE